MNNDPQFTIDVSTGLDTAILFTGWGDTPLGQPSELVPLLGRSMLQRAMERLAQSGCTRIHVALGESPLPDKAFLGDGSRWGCCIQSHTPTADEPFSDFCRRLDLDPRKPYALASASMVPLEAELSLHGALPAAAVGSACVWQGKEKLGWTGWGVFTGEWLLGQEAAISHAALEQRLLAIHSIERKHLQPPLSAASLAELLRSHDRLLARESDAETSSKPGRGSQIHPTARLVAPVHIGSHVQIGARAIVGPNVSIGDGSLIDAEAYVENSIVLPATYVGEGLELTDAIAGGDRLGNVRLNTVIQVTDAHLLSPTRQQISPGRPGWMEMGLARALRIILAPIQAWLSLAANIPARPPLQAHFHDHFYPGLSEVSQGRMRMLGPRRRPPTQIAKLPQDWQDLYAQHSCGLLNEAVLLGLEARMTEIQFACDAIACANQSSKPAMLRLTWSYVVRVLKSFLPAKGFARHNGSRAAISGQEKAANIYHHSVR